MSRLQSALAERARLVLVVGDAGIAKTRFVAEALARASVGGMVAVGGGCLPLVAEQVAWESRHLRLARAILFWFPASTSVQPIALYELGWCVASAKPLAVGAEPGYPRRRDVILQLSSARAEIAVRSTLAETVADLASHER